MGRWLNQLREQEKNTKTARRRTDKTPKTPTDEVLGVLGAPYLRKRENFSAVAKSDAEGFGGMSSGHIAEFHLNPLPDESDLADLFEERAAILEYHEGLCRAEAEALARAQIYGAEDRITVK